MPRHFDLQPLDRRIDIAGRAAAAGSSPSTCQARSPAAIRAATRLQSMLPIKRKAEFEMRREPLRLEADSRHRASSSSTSRKSSPTKCGSMNRSCSVVPQRTSRSCTAAFQNRAISARSSSCCVRLIRGVRRHFERPEFDQSQPARRPNRANTACRCRTRPGACCRSRRPADCRNSRSTSQGGQRARPRREFAGRRFPVRRALSCRASSTRGAWLVGPMNMPENKYDSDGWLCQ